MTGRKTKWNQWRGFRGKDNESIVESLIVVDDTADIIEEVVQVVSFHSQEVSVRLNIIQHAGYRSVPLFSGRVSVGGMDPINFVMPSV